MKFFFKPESGKAAYPGIFTGIAALFMNFIILKENRVVEGTGYSLFSSTPFWLPVAILLLIAAVLLNSFLKLSPGKQIINYIAGCLILSLTLTALVLSAFVLAIDQYAYGRISMSGGAWMLFLSSYLLMNSGKRENIPSLLKLLPWLIITAFALSGTMKDLGIFKEFGNEKKRFYEELGRHLYLSLRSVFQALIIGIPLGILAWKREKSRASVFAIINSLQTIPSLALFGILIPPLAWLSFRFPELRELGFKGVGQTPAIIALTLYALLPVTRNTFTSLSIIENRLLDAGRGMGMTTSQLFWKVELPIGLPIILGGVRIALVQTTGNTTVAALIGAGGLGFFVFRGLEQAAPDLILMGVIPIILLVILLDKVVGLLIKLLTPKGLELLYDSM
ncbi:MULTISPECIES: ABC transporter permease [unclassified Oceanispirochaeta]|uniref:ABC transporter permease n=1 Tax=unclassified Oceanispirochaeta TaxID=2635722 RepID=UPI000E09A187|nr:MULTISPECIES: ABC transporter permease [unclassified Oceanispirochaeta]MBF9015311.1 ABC transporter permease [Oceanispirochaeta sp. M2]NPD71769.1 ABC transporter permease [Oceanispirochaeta sp. M1]RDG32959.1 ABC transporter permease [Oceanispirochaeta sp. M1]